jgi:YHS domain-containing protein
MGIVRLILVAIVLVLGYYLIRRAIQEFRTNPVAGPRPANQGDIVQDPVCKIYIPRGTAISADIRGQTYFFCSRACAESFQHRAGRS